MTQQTRNQPQFNMLYIERFVQRNRPSHKKWFLIVVLNSVTSKSCGIANWSSSSLRTIILKLQKIGCRIIAFASFQKYLQIRQFADFNFSPYNGVWKTLYNFLNTSFLALSTFHWIQLKWSKVTTEWIDVIFLKR